MNKTLFIWLLALLPLAGLPQSYTVDTVPNTKLVDNSYVSNPDNILGASTVSQLNAKLADLEAKSTAQVAVVVIQSIGENDIVDFAQQLFEKWGIGKAKKDNGLLILMVMDQRTVRFHTGYGLEGILPDVTCKRIQMQQMVPQFKVEDYDRGILAGVEEVVAILSDPAYADEVRDESRREEDGWNAFFMLALIGGGILFLIWFLVLNGKGRFADSKKKQKTKDLYPEMRLKRSDWLIEFGLIPFGFLFLFDFLRLDTDNHVLLFLEVLYGYYLVTLLHKIVRMRKVVNRFLAEKNYYGAAQFYQEYQGFWLFMGILFAVPMLLFFFVYLGRKRFFRNHPRDCQNCGKPMHKLDERADDQYLKKAQIFEEQLGSVDYDVWLCDACKSTETWNYVSRSSKYDACPSCRTRAFFKESDRTIVSPTYESTGTGQITKKCKYCNHIDVSTYTISKLTPPSSSSDSSGGGSGSSGGSWGGGSSGGGGASSSW